MRITAGTPVPGSIVARGYNLNYHSTLSITDMTSLDLQAYVDQNERHSGAFSEERNIYHVEGMPSWRFGQHAGTLGLQYRNIIDDSDRRWWATAASGWIHPLLTPKPTASFFRTAGLRLTP